MTLSPHGITRQINQYIVAHSGFETSRPYLSMAHLADCGRKIVHEFLHGYTVEAYTHHMAYAGYEQEQDIRRMLLEIGILEVDQRPEVVAPFDSRLRGHLDGVAHGNVIEIKSVSPQRWDKLVQKGDRVPWRNFVQVQMYMRYSRLKNSLVIFRNRESYQHMVIGVPYHEEEALVFEEKAKKLLGYIDLQELPDCECGKCKELEHA